MGVGMWSQGEMARDTPFAIMLLPVTNCLGACFPGCMGAIEISDDVVAFASFGEI